ncbi:MAG: fibronectin type III domain-containing protein, partial [Acidimicrobiales bacterium]|nr:fibronectin type III domain-containing protein [Acidimicrobiales bacterium]
ETPEEETPEEETPEEGTPMATISGPPTDVTKTSIGAGQVTVEWTAPTDDGGSPIISYTVTRRLNGVFDSTCVQTATSCTLIGHSPPTSPGTNTYTYTVFATNSVGDGASSSAITHLEETAAAVPGIPTWVSATSADIPTYTLTWAAPTDDGGSPIISYTVTRTLNGAFDSTCVQTNTSCTMTGHSVPGVGNNTYTYTVFATNSVGDGLPSAAVTRVCFRGPDSLDQNNNVVPGPSVCNDGN